MQERERRGQGMRFGLYEVLGNKMQGVGTGVEVWSV